MSDTTTHGSRKLNRNRADPGYKPQSRSHFAGAFSKKGEEPPAEPEKPKPFASKKKSKAKRSDG